MTKRPVCGKILFSPLSWKLILLRFQPTLKSLADRGIYVKASIYIIYNQATEANTLKSWAFDKTFFTNSSFPRPKRAGFAC